MCMRSPVSLVSFELKGLSSLKGGLCCRSVSAMFSSIGSDMGGLFCSSITLYLPLPHVVRGSTIRGARGWVARAPVSI